MTDEVQYDSVNHRDGTRLEIDDPGHCKDCGAELPTGPMDATDSDGRPMIWSSHEGRFNTIETCPDCWVRNRLSQLVDECNDRFAGVVPEVMPNVE